MSQPRTRSRARTAGIVALLVFAFACTVAGVCMLAFADSTRILRIGIVVAAWGFLLGTFGLHSTGVMSSARASLGMDNRDQPGQDIALRRSGEVELESDAAARREYEMQLELMLRRQMEHVLREQVAELRRDIAGLRGEVLEAVDGRLRLERVETTRIIGSDLAALHDEVQRLHVERGTIDRESAPIAISSAPPSARSGSASASAVPSGPRSELWTPTTMSTTADRTAAPVTLESTPSEPKAVDVPPVLAAPASARPAFTPPPTTVAPATPAPPRAAPPRAEPLRAPDRPAAARHGATSPSPSPSPSPSRSTSRSASPPSPPATAERTPDFDRDPFAGLPRLSAFQKPDGRSGPPSGRSVPAQPAPVPAPTGPAPTGPARANAGPETAAPDAQYVGRRRRAADR